MGIYIEESLRPASLSYQYAVRSDDDRGEPEQVRPEEDHTAALSNPMGRRTRRIPAIQPVLDSGTVACVNTCLLKRPTREEK
jgi:hypothetical protein